MVKFASTEAHCFYLGTRPLTHKKYCIFGASCSFFTLLIERIHGIIIFMNAIDRSELGLNKKNHVVAMIS